MTDIALILAKAQASYTQKNNEGKVPLQMGSVALALKLQSLREEAE